MGQGIGRSPQSFLYEDVLVAWLRLRAVRAKGIRADASYEAHREEWVKARGRLDLARDGKAVSRDDRENALKIALLRFSHDYQQKRCLCGRCGQVEAKRKESSR